MSTIDRCTCYQELIKHVGDSFARFRITEKDESCPEHGELEHILATGRYTDRRGRVWKIVRSPLIGTWWGTPRTDDVKLVLHENKMRLLIERDQHRDECEGLKRCEAHPVPFVNAYQMFKPVRFVAYRPNDFDDEIGTFHTLPEAMDAARALAVGE